MFRNCFALKKTFSQYVEIQLAKKLVAKNEIAEKTLDENCQLHVVEEFS